MPRSDVGLLLVNIGTPDAPRKAEVRRYLREFLSDPRVIDTPAIMRWLVLNLFILPSRPRRSAEAYVKIWTERGSPLLFHSRDLAAKVQARVGEAAVVQLAMRYGSPSIGAALDSFHAQGIRRLILFPLYPQYSSAATGSSVDAVRAAASRLRNAPEIHVVPPFYDDRRYIGCFAEAAAGCVQEVEPELVFFSFHGLPERQIRKSDRSGAYCLERDDCCAFASARNPTALAQCYRAQCFTTARLLAESLGIAVGRRVVCFQSRLGRTPWIRPFTDVEVREAARRGVRRAVIVVPSFVADCLETLEEIALRAEADWRAHGGE